MDAREAAQRVPRRARQPRERREAEIDLHDLVALARARVRNLRADRERLAGLEAGLRQLESRVREARVAEAIAEGIERSAVEVAVGAARHRVVGEGRELVDALVEGHRQAARRVVVAGQGLGDRGATLLARVPRLQDRVRVLVRPVDRERAAAHQHHHERLARRLHGLEQLLFLARQVEARAIAALEAGLVDARLLAFEVGGDADDGDHDVRGTRGRDRPLERVRDRQAPDQARRRDEGRQGLDLDLVTAPLLERDLACGPSRRPATRGVDDRLAVEEQAVAPALDAEHVRARQGRRQEARPARRLGRLLGGWAQACGSPL